LMPCILKIRDGAVANRPVYIAREGAKHGMACPSELRNRGVQDVMIVACDGLKGLPDAVAEIWPLATVVYTAPTVEAAEQRFAVFEADWGGKYPAIIRLWRQAWERFCPFLTFPPEIRRVAGPT
jgi:putative transposase